MNKPAWLEIAEQNIGQSEVPGTGSNNWIKNLWFGLKGGWLWKQYGEDDSLLAWCGAFLAFCLTGAGIAIPKAWYRASSYLDWGVPVRRPLLGCVAIKKRKGGNHVFFPVGISKDGLVVVGIGGNQSDRVRYSRFDMEGLEFRYPPGVPMGDPLPIMNPELFLTESKMD
jgi:uncharacterized protein (TIGR02594 family)